MNFKKYFLIGFCILSSFYVSHTLTRARVAIALAKSVPQGETKVSESSKPELQKKLFEAVENGNADEVVQLLQQGADIDVAKNYIDEDGDSIEGETPLHSAIDNNVSAEIIKILCDHGSNVNAEMRVKCKSGSILESITPLHSAIEDNASAEIIKILCDHGSNVNAEMRVKCKSGSIHESITPLHRAIDNNVSAEIIKILLDNKGSNVNAEMRVKCKNGLTLESITPLHSAIDNNVSAEIIKILLDKGAHVNAKTLLIMDEHSQIKIKLAIGLSKLGEIINKLGGPEVFPRSSVTPMDLAIVDDSVNDEVIKILYEYGGHINAVLKSHDRVQRWIRRHNIKLW